MTRQLRLLGVLLCCAIAVGCSKTDNGKTNSDPPEVPVGGSPDEPVHPDKGPNGGDLIELGKDHKYHGEVVHDEKGKTVTIYIVDGSGKNYVAIDAKDVKIKFNAHGEPDVAKLIAKPMDGDEKGKSSRFVTVENNEACDELVAHFDDKDVDPTLIVMIDGANREGKIEHSHEEGKTHVHPKKTGNTKTE